MKLTVLTAAEGADWESELLAELAHTEHSIDVVRRCVDVVDLLATSEAGLASAALIDAHLRRFDADCHDRLHASRVAVVGVVQPTSSTDQDRLRSMGVQYFLPAGSPAVVVASVLQTAVAAMSEQLPAALSFGDPAFASEPAAAPPLTDSGAGDLQEQLPGSVIAVWGPTGAPGRTTVAIGLAEEISRLDHQCLLIDADVYGGVVAASLGLLDESPGLAAACRQAQSRRLDGPALAALAWQITDRLSALTGIARADRWPEIRPSALTNVLDIARRTADYTVLDLGFGLETDEELSFDTMAPRRNGATLAALECADLILAVGSADPIGIQRLVRGLSELKSAAPAAPIWIVLNRVRRGPSPGDPRRELLLALERFAGQSAAALLPYDLTATDATLAAGRTLAEVAPSSSLRLALVELAAAVVGVPAPRKARRRGARVPKGNSSVLTEVRPDGDDTSRG